MVAKYSFARRIRPLAHTDGEAPDAREGDHVTLVGSFDRSVGRRVALERHVGPVAVVVGDVVADSVPRSSSDCSRARFSTPLAASTSPFCSFAPTVVVRGFMPKCRMIAR